MTSGSIRQAKARKWIRPACEAPKTRHPCEAALDHPASGQQHEAAIGFDLQLNAVALLCLASHFAGIARIHVRKHHALAGQFLYRIGQLLDLCAIPLIGWYHIPCQQLTQSIDRQMHFRTLAALRAVVAGARAGFRCRLQSAAVQDHDTGLRFASIPRVQQFMQLTPRSPRNSPLASGAASVDRSLPTGAGH